MVAHSRSGAGGSAADQFLGLLEFPRLSAEAAVDDVGVSVGELTVAFGSLALDQDFAGSVEKSVRVSTVGVVLPAGSWTKTAQSSWARQPAPGDRRLLRGSEHSS